MTRQSVTITAAWIGGGAVVLAALIAGIFSIVTSPRGTAQPVQGVSRPAEAPASEATRTAISFQEYVAKLEALDGRFREQEEFVDGMLGKEINWEGFVVSVSSHGDERVGLMIESGGPHLVDDLIMVGYESSLRERLFALHKGDRVMVRGVYEGGMAPTAVRGITFEFLQPASSNQRMAP